MTARRFFQIAWLLPFAGSAAGWGAGLAGIWQHEVVWVLAMSIVVGGVPYIALAATVLLCARKRATRWLRGMTIAAPILFVPIQAIFFAVCDLVSNDGPFTNSGVDFLVYASYAAIVLGFSYVIVVNGGYFLLNWLGLIGDLEPAS